MTRPHVKKMKVCMLHLDRLIALKGEEVAIREMRKHAAWYLKGLPKNAKIRNKIMELESRDTMEQVLMGYVLELEAKQDSKEIAVG